MDNMDKRAFKIVKDYIDDHVENTMVFPQYKIFIVWKCKTLQNWKYLISTTLFDSWYFELTYNGDECEWYLDVYIKQENRVIRNK